jgi:hypothetical protein
MEQNPLGREKGKGEREKEGSFVSPLPFPQGVAISLFPKIISYDKIETYADVAELADALDLGSSSERSEGSSPFIRIFNRLPDNKFKIVHLKTMLFLGNYCDRSCLILFY